MSRGRPIQLGQLRVPFLLCGGVLITWLWLSGPDQELTPVDPPKRVRADVQTKKTVTPERTPTEVDLPPEKRDPVAQAGLGSQVSTITETPERKEIDLPSDLNLGEHVIPIREEGWSIRLEIALSSDDPSFVRFAAPLRRRLIQMLYFLVSRRALEGVKGHGGEQRLQSDLEERYAQVLRHRSFTLTFLQFQIEENEDLIE